MIPQELLDKLHSDKFTPSENESDIMAISADEWVNGIDEGLLNLDAKQNLLTAISDTGEMVDVLIRLSEQADFGIAIARTINTDKHWDALTSLLDKHGLKPGLDEKKRIRALGRFLTDTQTMFWFFRLLFSAPFISALSALVYDRDKKIRQNAVESLAQHHGVSATSALIKALDDTSDEVKKSAVLILKSRLSSEEIDALLKKREAEARELGEMARNAKKDSEGLFSSIPGFGALSNVFGIASATITDAASAVKEGAGKMFNKMWGSNPAHENNKSTKN